MGDYFQAVDEISSTLIRENASDVDEDGQFPAAAIDAFAARGLLGLISATEVGGLGQGIGAAVRVIERIAAECGSTAMVLCMHYSGAAVIEKFGPEDVRRDIAAGRHLTTLAFSEKGSRSQFWAPVSTARAQGDAVLLDARKSWVTSAHHADSYVWSSRPVGADGVSTIWLVRSKSEGLTVEGQFNGMGLRGNDSTPVTAENVEVTASDRLGEDGAGLDVMLGTVLPLFNVLTSANAVGLMEGVIGASAGHAATRFEHSGSTLADLATQRARLAEMRIAADETKCLLYDTVAALEAGREDAQLRVLESKASAGDTAARVVDLAMRFCGGVAFRRELGVERRFRDARAGLVMAPTSDHLREFIGRALCGLPVFG
jgi:alkylation response protein AidB-like acyl-CoA dehydrogenase